MTRTLGISRNRIVKRIIIHLVMMRIIRNVFKESLYWIIVEGMMVLWGQRNPERSFDLGIVHASMNLIQHHLEGKHDIGKLTSQDTTQDRSMNIHHFFTAIFLAYSLVTQQSVDLPLARYSISCNQSTFFFKLSRYFPNLITKTGFALAFFHFRIIKGNRILYRASKQYPKMVAGHLPIVALNHWWAWMIVKEAYYISKL